MAGTAEWLEAALKAERDFLFAEIERRHRNLISEFGTEFQRQHPSPDNETRSKFSERTEQSIDCNDAAEAQPEDDGSCPQPMSPNPKSQRSVDSKVTRNNSMRSPSAHTVFDSLREEPQEAPQSRWDRLESFVASDAFEVAFSLAIVANFVVLIFETQWRGTDTGYQMGYTGVNHSGNDTFPNANNWWKGLDWTFGIVFTVETLVKMVAFRWAFRHSPWNVFDAFVVFLWWIDRFATDMPIPPMMLRVTRMAKLIRMARLVRTVQSFDSLFVLTHSLKSGISAAFWSLLFLFVMESLAGVCLAYMLEDFMRDAGNPTAKREEVYMYYGTFTRTFLTMFELSLGNWMPPTRAVTENVNEWYMPLFLLHKLTIGFAVLMVISGVFLHNTFTVASMDNEAMVRKERIALKAHTQKIKLLFQHADTSADGVLDEHEFRHVVSNKDLALWLSAQGLSIQDGEECFQLLQKSPGSKLSAEDLVSGTARLKGNARSIDLLSVKTKMSMLDIKVDRLMNILLDPNKLIVLKEERPSLAPGGAGSSGRMFCC